MVVDRFGNHRPSAALDVGAVLYIVVDQTGMGGGAADEVVVAAEVAVLSGRTVVSWDPNLAIRHYLNVTVDGLLVAASPFAVDVVPGVTDPSRSYIARRCEILFARLWLVRERRGLQRRMMLSRLLLVMCGHGS